ncbi:hypothetical protein [Saccharicrinis fermentans]|uniref:Fluoride ion transporter CrcB n=2 Tax=Saccharicrinis fermentans TaxID=982 RepID=W7YEX9_9BACT|nr:hypothetical protein [Saccharicrinis fermentans]GAF06033.1 hypothetical protein JCM21142_134801 [Saccharicrinis fermentans DSM 9555 = JCM 21142]
MIIKYSIIVLVTQLIFIGCRTWNVKAISQNNIPKVLISGAFVNLSWLVSIAIGSVSMYELINDFSYEYIPVVICSVLGGTIGSFLALTKRRITLPKMMRPDWEVIFYLLMVIMAFGLLAFGFFRLIK